LHPTPLFRLPVLIIVFALSFLIVSRQLSVFTEDDFDLLENALPHALRPSLEMIERLLVRKWIYNETSSRRKTGMQARSLPVRPVETLKHILLRRRREYFLIAGP